ncbi:insulinase family protein [Carboxylicivirga mesophila]|uniref:Insulinase family protein n=1 Tax=Carboxylicivirga mesophila TaxID=1166478 RepID=A0ABS5KD51_9BACT|nr:M16 family metallopeptidase [Carboxylicivirga mesophila]MBS2212945.1 insulinase family protein [Carboxylicivirga mesophila]
MKKLVLLVAVLGLFASSTMAQQYDLNAPVPVDPDVRTGVLENGLTYYIRHNQEPKERASFYIIQNVGAILEDDSQDGLAHFLEHMAFNGTKHFPDKGVISTLEKHGIAFGRNINAYTAQDETVYNISNVPVGPTGLMDTCLLILHDWSNYLSLDEEEIDAERGVISEEWRTRRDAGFRTRAQMMPALLNNSKYAERDVIGELDVIKGFEYDELRRFYHDWYRTDLQAIAIVGDFDAEEMEQKVIKLFSKIPAVDKALERYEVKVAPKAEPTFALALDKENPQSSISMYIRHEAVAAEYKNHNTLKTNYKRSLIRSMISARISELLQKGNPPFINGSVGFSDYPRTVSLMSISATAKENEEAIAFESILTEVERVKRHGFTEGELERAKASMLLGYENYYKQRDKINHDSYCKEIASLYLENTPMPGIEYEYKFAQAVIPSITADELSAYFNSQYTDENRVIIVSGPDKEGVQHLNQAEAFAIIEKVANNSNIEAYVDEAVSSSLVEELPVEGKIVSERQLDDFDAVEWTLSNNTKVVYRYANYNKNQVALSSYSKGGSSLYGVADLPSVNMTSDFVPAFGIGNYDAIALKKALTGKKASVGFNIGGLSEGINGSCRTEDFETMMQLAYLHFEQPRFDEEAYNALMARYMAYVANMGDNPKKIMQDSISQIRSNYHERSLIFNADYLQKVSFERMEEIYKERFNNAADFTFFIVGDIEKETAKELATKYLGAITSNNNTENWVNNEVNGPKGTTKKTIPLALSEPKATVQIYYNGNLKYTPENRIGMSFISAILRLRYTESVREKEGGTYGVGVRASTNQFPQAEGDVSIQFDCDPERANDLIPLIYVEIENMMKTGASDEDITKTRKNILKSRAESKEQNSYWMNNIYSYYVNGTNMALAENYEDIVENMTSKDIKKLAKQFFKKADKIEVVFVPKED